MTNKHILVVDDQIDVLRNIGLTLRMEGFEVLEAADGREALARLREHPVDLILADVAMPHLNGYQLYEQVRQNPAWLAIPFLLLTARSMDSDIRYGKELGVDDYLTKPIDPLDLLAAVRGKLRRAQDLDRAAAVQTPAANETLQVGRLRLSESGHQAWLDDRPIHLSPSEFKLLQAFLQVPDRVQTHEDLIEITHDLRLQRADAGDLLRPLIRSLRSKLAELAGGRFACIDTVRGVGYRLNAAAAAM